MTRDEWLNQHINTWFKNKEFFPNLNKEDLDEVLETHDLSYDKEKNLIIKKSFLRYNYNQLINTAMNLRYVLNEPMIITSGFRSKRKHLEIYKKKGIPEDKIPMSSKHLSLQAFDFRTKDIKKTQETIKKICKEDGKVSRDYFYELEHKLDITMGGFETLCFSLERSYFEEFDYTPSWIHVQIEPPRSRNRFFKP